jgi:hypothetical protein
MTTPLGAALNSFATFSNQFIEVSFPDKCAIQRSNDDTGDYGTGTPEYETVSGMEEIGCSWAPMSPTSAAEYVRAGQINEIATYKMTIASAVNSTAVDIKAKDRIVVAARGIEPERTFEVKGILRNSGLPLTVLCTLED